MSGSLARSNPRRIKAAHRRRRKVASGQSVQRYYDPQIGRFLSVDPVTANSTNGTNFNRYWYANNNPYKFTDPDGRFGIVGAVIGGVIEVGVQMVVEGKSLSQVDKSDVAVAMAVGAVTGGIGGRLATNAAKGVITTAKAVTETAKAGAAANAIGSGAASVANGEAPDAGKMVVAGAAGALGSGAGAKLGNAPTARLESMSKAGGVAGHIADTTRAAGVGRATEASTSTGQVTANAAAAAVQKKVEQEIKR